MLFGGVGGIERSDAGVAADLAGGAGGTVPKPPGSDAGLLRDAGLALDLGTPTPPPPPPPGPPGGDCNEYTQRIYTVDVSGQLTSIEPSSTDPTKSNIHVIPSPSCLSKGYPLDLAVAMAVSRVGMVLVASPQRDVWEIDPRSGNCATSHSSGGSVLDPLTSLAYVAGSPGATSERLFGVRGTALTAFTLGEYALAAGTFHGLSVLDSYASISSSGDDHLAGLFVDPGSSASSDGGADDPLDMAAFQARRDDKGTRLALLDQKSGMEASAVAITELPKNWSAAALWKGDVWVFQTIDRSSTNVFQVRRSDGAITTKWQMKGGIIGAGVSSCAPSGF